MPKQWVIPDIHGCFHSLKALIETQIIPSVDDQLLFLGDFRSEERRVGKECR